MRKASENYQRKDARINIRLSQVDLEQIKQKAAYEESLNLILMQKF